jgi:type IV pilus assembly protein PilM
VMDVGTDASNLVITDGGKIIWQRPIPLGGNNFTRALTKELKLTFAKAEHLKRNAAKSPDMASILKAIKPVLTDFVGEVQRSLGYFTNTHRDAHVAHLFGLGSAFKLPGLQKYLADKLSLEVKKPTRFEKLSGDTVLSDPLFQENLLTFPIAYGLALQGLGQARLTTNLLPRRSSRTGSSGRRSRTRRHRRRRCSSDWVRWHWGSPVRTRPAWTRASTKVSRAPRRREPSSTK